MLKKVYCDSCKKVIFELDGEINGVLRIKCKSCDKFQIVEFDGIVTEEINDSLGPRDYEFLMRYPKKLNTRARHIV